MIISSRVGFLRNTTPINPVINITLPAGDSYEINAFSVASAVGTPSANVIGGVVNLYAPYGVYASRSTSVPAFQIGSGWGTGWSKVNVILTGSGLYILGKGGLGGSGGVLFNSNGTITFGVGGGGGAGKDVGLGGGPAISLPNDSEYGNNGEVNTGGAGRNKRFTRVGTFLGLPTNGENGGPAVHGPFVSGYPSLEFVIPSGAFLNIRAGGGGGGGRNTSSSTGSYSGAGGGPGDAGGGSSGGFAPGGLGGNAISRPQGAGTVTFSGSGSFGISGSVSPV